jgi:hypothetical protein
MPTNATSLAQLPVPLRTRTIDFQTPCREPSEKRGQAVASTTRRVPRYLRASTQVVALAQHNSTLSVQPQARSASRSAHTQYLPLSSSQTYLRVPISPQTGLRQGWSGWTRMRGRVPLLLRLARRILVWSAQAGLACLACLVWHGGPHSKRHGSDTQDTIDILSWTCCTVYLLVR